MACDKLGMRLMIDRLHQAGLGTAEALILLHLATERTIGRRSNSGIAATLDMNNTSVSRICNRLIDHRTGPLMTRSVGTRAPGGARARHRFDLTDRGENLVAWLRGSVAKTPPGVNDSRRLGPRTA